MVLASGAIDREVATARMRRIEDLVMRLEKRLPRVVRSRPDTDAWLAAEHLLEQAVRTASRLAAQFVAAGALGAPESAAGMFACLGEKGWLPAPEAAGLVRLADAAERLADGSAAADPAALRVLLAGAPKLLRAFLRTAATRLGSTSE
ncbi:MAG TPA: hypothetical protein VKM54_20935 [Myxococcota bacterium]|nr:hypothetical protein [Myxococcota bacterium]